MPKKSVATSQTPFLQSTVGRWTVVAAVIAAVVLAYSQLRSTTADATAQTRDRMFVDSTNGQAFTHELVAGESVPVTAPSGGKTGYPSELCFWTTDGQASKVPTYVLLNETVGKPGPTFCPVCHRLVVGHNPQPMPGKSAPPTEAEWRASHPDSKTSTTLTKDRDAH